MDFCSIFSASLQYLPWIYAIKEDNVNVKQIYKCHLACEILTTFQSLHSFKSAVFEIFLTVVSRDLGIELFN